jgi:hypothetical protein
LGDEYFLDLFSEEFSPGLVDVVHAASVLVVGQATIQFENMSFSVTVPLSLLGGDDGRINYGIIVGDYIDMSDEARNGGESPAFSVPEPGSLAVCLVFMITLTTVRTASQCKLVLGRACR